MHYHRGHPERTSESRGGSAQSGQSKGSYIVTVTSWLGQGGRGSKSPNFEGTSFLDGPIVKLSKAKSGKLLHRNYPFSILD